MEAFYVVLDDALCVGLDRALRRSRHARIWPPPGRGGYRRGNRVCLRRRV